MRVVGGKAKGRNLKSVPGESTRPILDRVKTALFDTIRPRIADSAWLDLFAGSGSVGIEALSQGAKHCVFVDLEDAAIKIIRDNLTTCKLTEQAEVRRTDAFGYLKRSDRVFDFVYIAPPQYKSLWVEALHMFAERPQLVSADGEIIVQIDPKEYEPQQLTDFVEQSQRRYGNTLLLFFMRR